MTLPRRSKRSTVGAQGGFRCREELEAELEKKHGPKIRALWAREQAAKAALDKWGLAPENEKEGLMREKPTICAECNHAMHTNRPRESWECGVDIVELDVITGQKKGRPCVELNKGACEKFAPRPPMDIYRSFRTTSTGKAFGQGTFTDAYGKQRLEILPL